MSVPQRIRAVLLDALGTLMYFEPPAPLLRVALRERLGVVVPEEARSAAIRAEIAYYRAHLNEGRDPGSLADLRRRSAEAMRPALGVDASTDALTEALLAALRFRAYSDAAPALRALRARGLSIVVVSNWDHSLHERLAEAGLAPLVDGAVASAELGRAKPGPRDLRPRARARRAPTPRLRSTPATGRRRTSRARWRPACGRSWSRATDGPRRRAGVPVIRSLAELPALCGYA